MSAIVSAYFDIVILVQGDRRESDDFQKKKKSTR